MLLDSFLSTFLNLLNTLWNPPPLLPITVNSSSMASSFTGGRIDDQTPPQLVYQFLSNASFFPNSWMDTMFSSYHQDLSPSHHGLSHIIMMPFLNALYSVTAELNSTNVPTNSSPICDYRLFKLGPLSREGYNASVINNICPDSIFTPIVSGVFLLIYLSVVLMGLLGVMWKRKSGHVKARNPVCMILTILASLFFVTFNCLRFIVGRKIFPCILYTISFFVIPPAIGLPMIVRCIRIFFMYKLSTQKTTIYEGKRKSSKPPIDASTSQTDSRTQMNSLKPTTIAATTSSLTTPTMINGLNSILTMENSLEKTTCNNNDGETATLSEKSSQIQHEQNYPHVVVATPTSDVMMSVMTNSNNFDTTTTTTTSTTAATTTTTNMIHVEMKDISIDHHPNDTSSNKDTNRDTAESKYEDTEPMDEDSRSWFTAELESEISQNNVEMKKLKFYRALVSYKFILALYAILFFVHLAIWAIFGAADEAVYQQSGKHVFLWNVGMFVFDTGCVTNTNTVFLLAAEAFFYIIVEIVFIIMLFFADRDTWGIKKETFVLLIIQICTALAYLICGQIEGIRFLTDYFVPYGFTLLTYSLVEVFISVVLPVCYAISHDRKEKATYAESEVELLLKNKKAFALLLDFATRSYCSEDILAYQDFEKYKKMSSRNRKKLALTLLNKYLKSGAPLELNISGLDQKRAILEKIISDLPVPPRDLFEEIKILCLNNMIDVFERLKASNMEVREMVSNYKRVSRTEPKVQNSD